MRVNLNQAAINELLRGPHGPVVREVNAVTRRVEMRAKTKVGVDSGRLRSSIQRTLSVELTRVVGRVGTAVQYGLYHHQGTGIYGPRRRPIRPKKAGGVLVFTPKGSTQVVVAREVQGSRPNPFLVDALREVSPWPVVPTRVTRG